MPNPDKHNSSGSVPMPRIANAQVLGAVRTPREPAIDSTLAISSSLLSIPLNSEQLERLAPLARHQEANESQLGHVLSLVHRLASENSGRAAWRSLAPLIIGETITGAGFAVAGASQAMWGVFAGAVFATVAACIRLNLYLRQQRNAGFPKIAEKFQTEELNSAYFEFYCNSNSTQALLLFERAAIVTTSAFDYARSLMGICKSGLALKSSEGLLTACERLCCCIDLKASTAAVALVNEEISQFMVSSIVDRLDSSRHQLHQSTCDELQLLNERGQQILKRLVCCISLLNKPSLTFLAVELERIKSDIHRTGVPAIEAFEKALAMIREQNEY